MPRRNIRNPKQTSFEFIMQEDSRQEARQREKEDRLLSVLNSCSKESRLNYAELLKR